MAILLQFLLLILSSTIAISSAAVFPPSPSPSPSPSPVNHLHSTTASSNFTAVLSSLLFDELSTATASLPNTINTTTIFAPSDSSLLTCSSCSLPLLLLEHSIPGLYPINLLRILPFGTKIESLACNHCLTITSTRNTTASDTVVFVGGAEINRPDLYNDGRLIVHGIHGYLTHLSPLSCDIERMTSLSFPPYPPNNQPFFIMRLLLKDAMHRLRISGYSLLALAMRERISELIHLRSLTLFAVDDAAIFSDRVGHLYVSDLMLHIVPNQRLMAADLIDLPANTSLATMERGESVVVTVAGGGGLLTPMRINHVKITRANLLYNSRIVVHGVSAPFPRLHQTKMGYWPDRTAEAEDQDQNQDQDLGPTEMEKSDYM